MTPAGRLHLAPLTREYAGAHAEELIALNRGSSWDQWTVENLLSDRPGKWKLSWVACCDETPVGYAIVSRRLAGIHLHHIVIGSDWRSRGIGRKLLSAIASLAVESAMPVLTLKVYDDNTRAIAFYEKLGFSAVGPPKNHLIEMSIATTALMAACQEHPQ